MLGLADAKQETEGTVPRCRWRNTEGTVPRFPGNVPGYRQ